MPSPRVLSTFSRAEVLQHFKQAHRVLRIPGLTFLCAPQKKEFGRLLVVTPAATGNSPQRNKIRRQLKALFYEQKLFTYGYDCVVLIKREALALSFTELAQLLTRALNNTQKIVPKREAEILKSKTASPEHPTNTQNSACAENSQCSACPKNRPVVKRGNSIIARLLIFLIQGIRPLLGPACCRYQVTCTQFAIQQLQEEPLLIALWRIIKRVFSCNPFYKPKE
ncbi:ribonuclease P protein component [Methylicorpusculum sp.]|uniref:ribonuclease P protein component n=1 Tax=Methylicorpusculum sp. TaxID=2713644 RepID=UPI002AB7F84D|nr:ribonuclease P protein component [Methylicorpusculum sp.]MDZ4154482.1 ribonuclease P protein component [Methylicorpusculum sp.]